MQWKRNKDGSYIRPGYLIYKRRVLSNSRSVLRFCLATLCKDTGLYRDLADHRTLRDAKVAADAVHPSWVRI